MEVIIYEKSVVGYVSYMSSYMYFDKDGIIVELSLIHIYGPETHLKKQGTPTMGGLVILTSIVITSLFYLKEYPKIIPVLFVTVG